MEDQQDVNMSVRGDGVVESTTQGGDRHGVVVVHDPFSGYEVVPAHWAPRHPESDSR